MSLGPLMVDIEGTSLTNRDREILRHPLVGGVILFSRNYDEPAQLAALTAEIHGLRSPALLIAVDHEGGRVQRFRRGFSELPAAAVIGEQFDLDEVAGLKFATECAWLMATELRVLGVDFSFAPVLDLKNPRSRIIDDRAFHRDPNSVARIAQAYCKGLHEAGVAAVGKHFPGHGTVEADSHLELPVDDRSYYDIVETDLLPFRLNAATLEGIMPAHIRFPQIDVEPAGYSKVWIQSVLRQDLGFQGIVFSDDLNMQGAAGAGTVEQRAAQAINAGCDVILLCNDRPGVERLLSHFKCTVEPLSQVRLMRMHGKRQTARLNELQRTPRWRAVNDAIARADQTRNLDLGDDGLV